VLQDFKLPRSLPKITLSMFKDIYNKMEENKEIDIVKVNREIDRLKNRKSILVDSFLD
jgi:hypothetical protein